MIYEFAGQSGKDASNATMNSTRLVNLFREPMTAGGYVLRSVPGMALFANLNRAFLQALAPYKGNLLSVCGGRLFEISDAAVVRDLGALESGDQSGISVNTGIAGVVAGGVYSTWDGTSLTPVAVGSDDAVGSVAYLGGYTIVTELGGRRFWWSDLADPTTMPALNFASAEITEDDLIRSLVVGDVLVLFKANGLELWGLSGLSDVNAFARISGAMIETGLAGYALCCTIPNGAAFVGDDGRVHVYSGGSLQPVSTPPVEAALHDAAAQSVFYYSLRGHGFICVTFKDRPAWCYDVALGEWHERAQDDGPWTARASVFFGGAWRVGSSSGMLATLNDIRVDFDRPMWRRAISGAFGPTDRPFTIGKIEAQSRRASDSEWPVVYILSDDLGALGSGTLALGEEGYDSGAANVSLSMSRDGMTFGPLKPRPVGDQGDYFTRLIWRALGQFRRQAVMQLSVSCPGELPIAGAVEVQVI